MTFIAQGEPVTEWLKLVGTDYNYIHDPLNWYILIDQQLEQYHARFKHGYEIEFENEYYYTLWLLDQHHLLKN